jgi:hypothetical protein
MALTYDLIEVVSVIILLYAIGLGGWGYHLAYLGFCLRPNG